MAPRTKKNDDTPTPEELPKYPLILVVHTTSREEFKLDLGVADTEAVVSLRENISSSLFFTVKANNSWPITDSRGVDYIFNTEHVVAVEVRLDRH